MPIRAPAHVHPARAAHCCWSTACSPLQARSANWLDVLGALLYLYWEGRDTRSTGVILGTGDWPGANGVPSNRAGAGERVALGLGMTAATICGRVLTPAVWTAGLAAAGRCLCWRAGCGHAGARAPGPGGLGARAELAPDPICGHRCCRCRRAPRVPAAPPLRTPCALRTPPPLGSWRSASRSARGTSPARLR